MSLKNPLISIIISTKNSAETIERCIKSVKDQSYKRKEIIVVDNYSTDNTVKIAENLGVKVYLKGPERSSQKNFGAKMSKGEFLLFIDSDHIIEKNILDQCVNEIKKRDCDAIILLNQSLPLNNFWNRCFELEKKLYRDDIYLSAARFVRKKIFQEIGGYDEKLVAYEDYDLQARIGKVTKKICKTRSVIWHIQDKITLRRWIKKHIYYSKSTLKYASKNPSGAMKQLGPWRLFVAKNRKLLLRNPIETLGLLFLFGLKYVGVFIGILIFIYKKVLGKQ